MFLQFVKRWLAVGFWMAVIFIGSTDLMSTAHTSRFIGPFLRWLIPDISAEALGNIQFIIRKCGHVSEYAVLAVLFWRARRSVARAWTGKEALMAVGFCCAYAITDELHQHFVSSRYGSVWDVLIDTLGGAFGMGLVWLWIKWTARRAARTRSSA